MRRTAALVAVACALGLASAAAAAAATPRIITAGGSARYAGFAQRPGRIIYSGDGAAFLAGAASTRARLHWSTWNGHLGRGTGANWLNDCSPDCADGRFHAYHVAVKVYRPRRIAGRLLFTRMGVTYTDRRPRLPRLRGRTDTFVLRVSHGNYFWDD